jgi:RNA ligase-like protein
MKYPRTHHLPWSPGASSDDLRTTDIKHFVGHEVVVTEKLDGECTTITHTGSHARSLDTSPHPSRNWVRKLAGEVGYRLPSGHEIVGENLYARHSIGYEALPSYFVMFGAIYLDSVCVDWRSVEVLADRLKIPTVPVLYRGRWDEDDVKACWTGVSRFGGEQEGYVVRYADAFGVHLFSKAVMKYVRANHVQTDEHWLRKPVVKNGLQ